MYLRSIEHLRYFDVIPMHFAGMLSAIVLLSSATTAVMHTVSVGKGGLKFTPDSIDAAVGDTVQFQCKLILLLVSDTQFMLRITL